MSAMPDPHCFDQLQPAVTTMPLDWGQSLSTQGGSPAVRPSPGFGFFVAGLFGSAFWACVALTLWLT